MAQPAVEKPPDLIEGDNWCWRQNLIALHHERKDKHQIEHGQTLETAFATHVTTSRVFLGHTTIQAARGAAALNTFTLLANLLSLLVVSLSSSIGSKAEEGDDVDDEDEVGDRVGLTRLSSSELLT